MDEIETAKRLCDAEVLQSLQRCVTEERQVTARLLIHFGEVDDRGLFRDEGYKSMFDYAVRGLHMSDSEALLRIRVSRFVRRFPVALEMLERGEVHLTALLLLVPVMSESTMELLGLVRHKTKSEVQEIIAKYFPKPDVQNEVRCLPDPAATPYRALTDSQPTTELGAPLPSETTTIAMSAFDPRLILRPGSNDRANTSARFEPLDLQAPLSEGRYKIQFTASKRVNDKLEEAKALLSRQIPTGDLEAIFECALDLLIAEKKRKMFGLTDRPRAKLNKPTREAIETGKHTATPETGKLLIMNRAWGGSDAVSSSRYVPQELRRSVYTRDEGQCRFIGNGGARCPARDHLEFHHVVPYAKGGAMTLDNIELRCRAHNALQAERDFGRDYMKQRIEERRRTAQESARTHLEAEEYALQISQSFDGEHTVVRVSCDSEPDLTA